MEYKATSIYDTREIGQIHLNIYSLFEKHTVQLKNHIISFVSNEEIKENQSVHNLSKISIDVLKKSELSDYTMFIALSGDYHSLDEFRTKNIQTDFSTIQIQLEYIKVESQDGSPFPVNAFLLVPLNPSIMSHQKLSMRFKVLERDFFTGEELVLDDLTIPSIETSFNN